MRTTFFDPRTAHRETPEAFRDLIERLRPVNGSGSYPSRDWFQVLAQSLAPGADARLGATFFQDWLSRYLTEKNASKK